MNELTIVWRNPEPVRRLRAQRIQKYDFGGALYGIQESVSRGCPDLWLTTSTFEVRASHGRKVCPVTHPPEKISPELSAWLGT